MLLDVKNLSITFQTSKGPLEAVREISFSLERGETLGIVGESGCGKSITNLSLMGLLPETALVKADYLNFSGTSLAHLNEQSWQEIRGNKISMIFQDPMNALNPCFTVEKQLLETILVHDPKILKKEAKELALDLLDQVGIPAPKDRMKSFPHELSGGMAQRVMIAMAISCNPLLLIADEPTTALDVTIQAQILKLLKTLQEKNHMAMILVTHDLGVVAKNSERLQVMYAGEIVEQGLTEDIIARPFHPYTKSLLDSIPSNNHQFREPLPCIPGIVPDLYMRPTGCQFRPRCFKAEEKCHEEPLLKEEENGGRKLKCFFPN